MIQLNMEKRHRVFIAINLPEEVKRELVRTMERTKVRYPEFPAKWTAKDNLHITLEFLGDLTYAEIVDVCKITGEVAKNHKVFSVNLSKILYGPPRKMPPRMVWAQGERSEELAELKRNLQEELQEAINYKAEGKGFTPHITLARIKEWQFRQIEPDERPEVNEDINLTFTVESIEVMGSQLKREGPEYSVLQSCELKT